MEIHFKDEGARSIIVGGMIKKYLLEKSRIVWQAPNERNFHIFVEILDLPAEQKAKYGLTRPEDYLYINQGGSIRADGWDDAEELGLVLVTVHVYPVTGDPPLNDGGEKLIVTVLRPAEGTKLVGASGVVEGTNVTASLAGLTPSEFST